MMAEMDHKVKGKGKAERGGITTDVSIPLKFSCQDG